MSEEEEQIKDTQSNPLPPLENIFFLMIDVVSARDLERADFTGSSDPFCRIIANKQSWSTKTIMKNLNPEWNEQTQFVFFKAVEEIQFEVYDWDKGSKHDLIGAATLQTKEFYNENNKGFDGEIALKKCKKGSLCVRVSGRTVKPLELEQRCVTLETECKKQAEEINSKQQECQVLMEKNGQYAEQKNKLLKEENDLNEKLKRLKESITRCNSENIKKQEKIQQLTKQKNEYTEKIQGKQHDIDRKQSEYKQEQKKLEDAEYQYQSLQKEAKEKREELNQDY